MPNWKHFAFFVCTLLVSQTSFSQLGFSHQIGVIAGPVQFKSDFGKRSDGETNFGNSGFGIGFVHYLDFSYRRHYNFFKSDSYFRDHFQIRNEISWNKTHLEHLGKWVDPSKTSSQANQLRGHKGVAHNLDIGTQLEFYPLSIKAFQSFSPKFAPFTSFGVHFTSYTPQVSTTYENPNPLLTGNVTEPSNFYSEWAPGSIDASPGSTWSIVSSVGVRYKLDKLSDLMLDLRWQYYFSDWVDGLNHNLDYNKHNDWLLWLNIGYIYYLD
ncbi:glutamate dehydrogenase [Mariniflexile ostreae]|uniref:Glutamate dehydrogenase n=1 Tax=Mariniflexile ostreae TaxID=1520892 RepID=A0ABV5F816_9FLAO